MFRKSLYRLQENSEREVGISRASFVEFGILKLTISPFSMGKKEGFPSTKVLGKLEIYGKLYTKMTALSRGANQKRGNDNRRNQS